MELQTAYHIHDGAREMCAIDAQSAIKQHPDEWASEPWSASLKAKRAAERKAEAMPPVRPVRPTWLPMSTAPKDEEVVLKVLRAGKYQPVIGLWNPKYGGRDRHYKYVGAWVTLATSVLSGNIVQDGIQPVGWSPLPACD